MSNQNARSPEYTGQARVWMDALHAACLAPTSEHADEALIFRYRRALLEICWVAAADPGTHCHGLEPGSAEMYHALFQVAELSISDSWSLLIDWIDSCPLGENGTKTVANMIRHDGYATLSRVLDVFADRGENSSLGLDITTAGAKV